MAETTSRTLALLNLPQTHRTWSGSDLARRLEVTDRTLRRDIERLRELGYRIDANRGKRRRGTASRPATGCRRCC